MATKTDPASLVGDYSSSCHQCGAVFQLMYPAFDDEIADRFLFTILVKIVPVLNSDFE